jgi:hypothetical protein
MDFKDMITVLVGEEEESFCAHKDILCGTSGFFQDAFSGRWLESEKRTIRLPEQHPVAFRIYLIFRYQHLIDVSIGDDESLDRDSGGDKPHVSTRSKYSCIFHSYVLGDMLRDNGFCNALVDAWFDVLYNHSTHMSSVTINDAFEGLPETSKFRLLMVHYVAYGWTPQAMVQRIDKWHPDLLKGIVVATSLERSTALRHKTPWARGNCYYHIHVHTINCKCE